MKVPCITWEEREMQYQSRLKDLIRILDNSNALLFSLVNWQSELLRQIHIARTEEVDE